MASDIEEGKALAGIMFLLPIIGPVGIVGSIVLWAVKKDNKFVNYHFKQLLILWIASLIASLIAGLLILVLIGFVLLPIVVIGSIIIWIIGIINAFTGLQKPLPIIGKWGETFNF